MMMGLYLLLCTVVVPCSKSTGGKVVPALEFGCLITPEGLVEVLREGS